MTFDDFDRCMRAALRAELRHVEPPPRARDTLLRAAAECVQAMRDRSARGCRRATHSAQDGVIAYLTDLYLQRPSISV